MRKLVLILSFLLLAAGCRAFGHHHVALAAEGPEANKPLRVAASVFPVYIFASNVCAGNSGARLELLIPPSLGCPHDLTLRPADMRKLAQADVLIINGAGLEDFLLKALESLPKAPVVIDASAGALKLPAAGGHADHDHDHDHGMGGVNPHIFASPANAAIMVKNIAAGLARADPSAAALYERNGESCAAALAALGDKFEDVGKKAKNPKIALEHDALAYIARNARLEITAVFENSDSASVIAKLAANLKKEKPALLAGDSQYPDRLLKMLARESELPYASLDPCASGPADAAPDYYQKAMEKNLEILEKHFD